MNGPRAIAVAAVIVITMGAGLRVLGLSTCEVWADEAWWANKLVEGQVGWIRPPGYMWLTRQIISLHNTEATLRMLSLVASLAQLPLFFLLMRRVVTPWVALAATFVLAVHPSAVGFAKEFKPYALESLLHTALLLLAVLYIARPRTLTLVALALVAMAAPPFSWSTVFLYPGLFLAVGWHALRERRRTDVVVAAGGVVATLAVLAMVFAMRLRDANPHPEYWGGAYGVFYLGDSVVEGLGWYLKKTAALLSFPGNLRFWWWSTPARANPVSLVLGVIGLAVIVVQARRRGPRALLFALPFAVFLAFNVAGQWPYGVFRTNLFALVYTLAFAAFGLDAFYGLARDRGGARARLFSGGIVVVTAVLLAQALPVRPSEFQCKGSGTMALNASVWRATRMLRDVIAADPAPRPVNRIAFDGQACSALTYYRTHHETARTDLQWMAQPNVDVRCSVGRDPGWHKLLDEMLAQNESFYVIVGKRSTSKHTRARMEQTCKQTKRKALPGTWIHWCGRGDEVAPVLVEAKQ